MAQARARVDAGRRRLQLPERRPWHHQGDRRHPELDRLVRRRVEPHRGQGQDRHRRLPHRHRRPPDAADDDVRRDCRRHRRRHVPERRRREIAQYRDPREGRRRRNKGGQGQDHQARRRDQGRPDRGLALAGRQGRRAIDGRPGRASRPISCCPLASRTSSSGCSSMAGSTSTPRSSPTTRFRRNCRA